ncbi:MAG: hypothetical protein GY796_20235 [Chloroflexi bacterium]|nr:hypothetical protein [Chloroflexota bacterium]
MSREVPKRVGVVVGAEWNWTETFVAAINESNKPVVAELVKLAGTLMDTSVAYDVIVDRMSHNVPYYRAYLKHAALQGAYIINNPFMWDVDSKFLGTAVLHKLGLKTPRTAILPNKYIEFEATPDTFRNLEYPMDWEAIIDYVGVPAIFKDIHSGGRQFASRVHNVDELIQRYDESDTRTTILQEIIDSDDHVHAFVFGRKQVMLLRYSQQDGVYLPGSLSKEEGIGNAIAQDTHRITQLYGYDMNMVEFVIKDGVVFVINSTNPAPDIDRQLMSEEQFDWCVKKMTALVIDRVFQPAPQQIPFASKIED